MSQRATAREHQEHHDKEPEKRHYVGKVTNAVLQHRFYNLMINYNPNLFEDEKTDYAKKLKETVVALRNLGILESLMTKYGHKMDSEFKFRVAKFRVTKE